MIEKRLPQNVYKTINNLLDEKVSRDHLIK